MTDGVAPVAPSSLLTFLPLNQQFDQAQQLTLHRLVGGSIAEPISDYPVLSVEIFDGYQTFSTSYEFDETTALTDSTGTVAKYFRSVVHAGTNDTSNSPAGYVVHHFVNGLPPDVGDPAYPSVVDGSPLKTVGHDSTGAVVLETDLTWQVYTEVKDLDDPSVIRPLFGDFVRVEKMVTTKDGVSRVVDFSYNQSTGMPSGNTTLIYNADGAEETHATAMVYGYAEYDELRYRNILSPAVQSKQTVKAGNSDVAVTSVGVTTWGPFARAAVDDQPIVGVGGHVTYQWLGGPGPSDFDFAAWSASNAPPASWAKTSEVTVRTPHGLVQERTDPAGLVRSTRFDVEERLPVASFTNASLEGQEAYYYGFQDYEVPDGWQLDLSATPIITGNSHTGSRSLEIPAHATAVPLQLTPKDQDKVLLVSCWASTPASYDPSHPAGLRVQLLVDGAPLGNPVEVPFPAENGGWEYVPLRIDLSQHSAPSGHVIVVSVTLYNQGEVPVIVDNFAVASFEGNVVVNVYDEPFYLVVAEVGPYRTLTRWAYDSQLRPLARTESKENVEATTITYLSRQDASDTFDPPLPNITITLRPTGATFYDRFCNGGNWSANWASSQPGDWMSDSGSLKHTTRTAGAITFTAPAVTSDFFVAVNVSTAGALAGAIGLSVGDAVSVLWDPGSGRWTLTDSSGPTTVQASYTSKTPGSLWLLVVTDETALFFVDGRPTITYLPSQRVAGGVGLVAADPVAFSNFVIGQSPEVAVDFVDGSGKVRQRHALDEATSYVSATLYDIVGRAAVTTKTGRYDVDRGVLIPSYRASFASIDWTSGQMSGDIASSYPADEGYPYSRQRYEASPLGRVVEVGAPGKQFAIVGDGANPHTVKTRYGANQAGGFPAQLALPAGHYFLATTTDQDGVESAAVSDSLGQLVASGTRLAGAHYVTSSSRVQQELSGPVITRYLPNYYDPPDPATKQSWVATETYDMLGHVLARQEPDNGLTRYVYDLRGNSRFWQDAGGLAKGVIVYAKYDSLGAPSSKGHSRRRGTRPPSLRRPSSTHSGPVRRMERSPSASSPTTATEFRRDASRPPDRRRCFQRHKARVAGIPSHVQLRRTRPRRWRNDSCPGLRRSVVQVRLFVRQPFSRGRRYVPVGFAVCEHQGPPWIRRADF